MEERLKYFITKIKGMKGQIVTCLNNEHQIYSDNFKRGNVRVGKSYECTDELMLTTDGYFIKEFASLKGITIKSHVDRWGWAGRCLPKECFRIATVTEVKKYKIARAINAPFVFCKIMFWRIIRAVDRIVRWKYYKRLSDEWDV